MKNFETSKGNKYTAWMLAGLVIAFFQHTASGQSLAFQYENYGLEDESYNVIQNAGHLDDFFEKLLDQKTAGDQKIRIVHIGDSHIQADYFTHAVRKDFQHEFGNAGRGLIVPARVAGTNEPSNFFTSSSGHWTSKRCIYPDQPLPIGIGGITTSTTQPGASITLRMMDSEMDYNFNLMTLFFQKDLSSFLLSVKDTLQQEIALLGPYTDPFVNYARVSLLHPLAQITIETVKTLAEQQQATLFGVNLENGNNGVLYHAVGVNGAKYKHYNAAQFFSEQTTALNPDVFVISLGTNEALDYPYLDRSLPLQIDRLVQSLLQNNPHARFILVTPPAAFRRKVRSNPGIEWVRNEIIQYAVENGLAFWDMYKVMGGDDGARLWRNRNLLRPDGVHYTKDGYICQGNLFYAAIVKSYNNYVSLRHP